MSNLLLFASVLFVNSSNALTINKTIWMTPTTVNLESNGATIIELEATNNVNYWTLHQLDINNEGFDLQLTLNESWGFHPTQNTTLRIDIESNTVPQSNHDYNKLLLAFSQTYSNQYFTTMISLDEVNDHRIFGPCHNIPPYAQIYITGNIKAIVDTYDNGKGQWDKATQGYPDYTILPEILYPNIHVESPLTFILFNNPNDNYMLFTYYNPNAASRSCGFYAMPPNKQLDVFIVANTVSSTVNISSITITHSYQTSNSPTSDPTQNPTITPTSDPTITPTSDPTETPTLDPTINPTRIPTESPSLDPSLNPTESTNIPSYSSTNIPTDTPTKSESEINEIVTTVANVDDLKSDDTNNGAMYIVLIAICGLVLMMTIVFIILLRKRCRTNHHKTQQKVIESVQSDGELKKETTEMVTSNPAGNEDSAPIITPQSNAHSHFIKNTIMDEDDDNMGIEEMYDVVKKEGNTAGMPIITDDGISDDDKDNVTTIGGTTKGD